MFVRSSLFCYLDCVNSSANGLISSKQTSYPFTKAQFAWIFWPKTDAPSRFSIALFASSYVSYSTRAYPLINPVRRSKFMWKFFMEPYSEHKSNTSSSCASSWISVRKMIQPSIATSQNPIWCNTRTRSGSCSFYFIKTTCSSFITSTLFICWTCSYSTSLLYSIIKSHLRVVPVVKFTVASVYNVTTTTN